jgi:ribA/ribD-fused uncharacterized protein
MDRETLIARVTSGEAPEYLFFWGHRQRHPGVVDASCLSQWFPASFVVDGTHYRTAEHWMMAGKAKLFGDDESRELILASATPDEAKRLGRRVRDYEDEAWGRVRVDLVVEGNVAKFGQHAKLREFLLSTGNKVLVEASPRDCIWGIGLGRDNERARDPRTWRGRNLLGFALMQVRDRLRSGSA